MKYSFDGVKTLFIVPHQHVLLKKNGCKWNTVGNLLLLFSTNVTTVG